MIVKLNGEGLEVAEGLTFAELTQHVRRLLDHRVLVELRLNRETVSQALLEEIKDRPIYGEIELFSLDAPGLAAEVVEQARRYLRRLEGLELSAEGLPGLLEGFEWLNRALVLIPLGVGFPRLKKQVERLLQENLRLREQFSRSPAGLESFRPRLKEEFRAYRAIFREIGDRL